MIYEMASLICQGSYDSNHHQRNAKNLEATVNHCIHHFPIMNKTELEIIEMSAEGALKRTTIQCNQIFYYAIEPLFTDPVRMYYLSVLQNHQNLWCFIINAFHGLTCTSNSHSILNTRNFHNFRIYEILSPKMIKNGNQLKNQLLHI